jgi:hypothetical protein
MRCTPHPPHVTQLETYGPDDLLTLKAAVVAPHTRHGSSHDSMLGLIFSSRQLNRPLESDRGKVHYRTCRIRAQSAVRRGGGRTACLKIQKKRAAQSAAHHLLEVLSEQRQDRLRRLVGDRKRLDAQLLLDL